MDDEALVRDYLGRLDAAAWPLTVDRRAELVAEVREHIETALAEAGQRDKVTVRNVLERLGRPEEIVAEEAGTGRPSAAAGAPPPGATGSTWGAIEIIALLLLTVGWLVIPIFGPLVGLVFVWASTRWTRREKLIATAIVVVLLVLPVVGLLGVRAGAGIGQTMGGNLL